jgi:carboxyl-terminal processing protease
MNLLFRLLVIVTLTQGSSVIAQHKSTGTKSLEVVNAMEIMHIDPLGINDTLSSRVYQVFIESMADEFMLTQEDLKSLENYKYNIDDQILAEESTFYDSLIWVLDRNARFLSENLMDLVNVKDLVNSDLKYSSAIFDNYPQTRKELLLNWKKHLIISSIRKAQVAFPNTDISNSDSVIIILKIALDKQIEEELCDLKLYNLTEETKKSNQDLYFDAITTSYDPHSSYFSYRTKANFEEMLSATEDKFGFGLLQEDGLWKVSFIKPGSDAWSSGLVNVGDEIMSIKQGSVNGAEALIECATVEDMSLFLSDTVCKKIYMTIRKIDNSEEVVKMEKKIFASEENRISGLILENESKIGYISLPSFYASWDGYQVDGCANDVAKEILKLKKDSIAGLILDLRNNGGGSVSEAIDLAGIFIDLGPVGIVKYKEGKPKLLKDANRGRVYSGPLIVLINGASASASEIVAGALQYHNRALIAGSNSFGKATGQIVVPADTNTWASYYTGQSVPEDYVKVTQSRFYAPNNTSHQSNGIQPDIVVPSLFDAYYSKESGQRYVLNNPDIIKNVYFEPKLSIPIEELSQLSGDRISEDSTFAKIRKLQDSLTLSFEEDYFIPLDFKSVWEYYKIKDANTTALFSETRVTEANFTVNHSKYNNSLSDMDEEFNKMIRSFKTRLEKDVTINEAYLIMIDYINLINNK